MTYQPTGYCKAIFFILWGRLVLLTRFVPDTAPFTWALFLAGLPLRLYLKNLRVKTADDCLVKSTGRLFKTETVLPVKNIYRVAVTHIFPRFSRLPRLIRVFYPGQTVVILGLDGNQAARIREMIISPRLEKQ